MNQVDFILRQSKLLTKFDCSKIIEWVFENKNLIQDSQIEFSGYYYCDISLDEILSVDELKKISQIIYQLKNEYVKKYREVNNTYNIWDFDYIRFKWWKPGNGYVSWHSDHGGPNPKDSNRIISFLIYLSDNDCCTEFKRYKNQKTEMGSAIMFPTFFTHEHRGGICKKGLDRFVISGYFSYV